MSSFGELLVKAVRGLSAEEQDLVLRHLLEQQTGRAPQPLSRHGLWGQIFSGAELGSVGLGSTGLGLLPGGERSGTERERPSGGWQVVPVRLSAGQHEALKQWCEANDFSMAVVVRGLVDRFLGLQKPSDPPNPT